MNNTKITLRKLSLINIFLFFLFSIIYYEWRGFCAKELSLSTQNLYFILIFPFNNIKPPLGNS